MRMPIQGQCWRHYKGGCKSLYEIVGTGWHTETNDAIVVYKEAGTTSPLFVRPLSVFLGTTDEHKPRFDFERESY